MPYPPGTGPNDPNAPWNQPPAPECRDCGETIIRAVDHEGGCRNSGMGPEELHGQREKDAKVKRAEHQLERQRLEKAHSTNSQEP